MAEAKITLKIGEIEFSGEGEEKWIEKQLDKIFDKAEELIAIAPSQQSKSNSHNPMGNDPAIAKKALSTFLQEKGATTNQTKKFLATSAWLEAKGQNRLKTGDVTKALKDSQQNKLKNPSQTLADNIKKGYIEKDGDQYFVTEEGKKSL